MRRAAAVVLAALLAVLLALALAGCTKTITVTYKYRSLVGWYWVCDGPSWAPCLKSTRYHVTKAKYDRARIGHKLTLVFP